MHSTRLTTTAVVFLLAITICLVYATEEHHKRAPSGFTGVRGKKSIPDSAYSSEIISVSGDLKASDAASGDLATALVAKRAPSGFMGMRGKKPYPLVAWEGTYPTAADGIYKRAPSGFMGMRGKKEMEFTNYGEDYIKRAPSGFMGMRGKKDDDAYLLGSYNDEFYNDKRAPMGFFGMRGKKDLLDDFPDEDKRVPSGFFGMRGKKMPKQSGFFGMRGKKYPYEMRGKFVGVRGKKATDSYNTIDLDNFGEDLDLNQLMLLLTESEGDSDVWNGQNNNNGHNSQII